MSLILKRIAAWLIDWLIIMLYAMLLFAVVAMLAAADIVTIGVMHPLKGQLIGFLTLTFPVVLYGVLMEYYKRATLGKRIMKLNVLARGLKGIVVRNVLKFFPWEFAHAGILWINYRNDISTPMWIWMLLIVPQVAVVVYFVWIILTGGRKSLYDFAAGTEITQTSFK